MKTTENIHLKVGEIHHIELKGGASKGYQWIAFPEINKVVSIDKSYSEIGFNKKQPGSNANEIFSIRTLQKGKTTIHLKQIETWKTNPTPINEHVCKIVVQEESDE